MGELTFIVGGARSGKSDYAQTLAESLAGPRCFVATCPKIDPEMEDRIVRHQRDREGKEWRSVEEELDLAAVLGREEDSRLYLIDCITLWVNNLMFAAEQQGREFGEEEMTAETEKLLAAIAACKGDVICVSNEVGMSIVPDNPAARRYRDLVGRCNRMLAADARRVSLVSCGIALQLKE